MHQIEVTSKLRGSHLLEDCSHRLEKLEIGADSRSGRFHNSQNGSGTKWRQMAPIIFTSIQLLHNLKFVLTSPNWSKKCANWHFIVGSFWVNDWKCLGSKCCSCVVINFYFQPTASTTHNLSLLWRLNSHEPHNEVYRGQPTRQTIVPWKKNPRPIENIVKGTFSFFGRLKTVQTDLVY